VVKYWHTKAQLNRIHTSIRNYILSKDEGGRHTPFFNGYRPQFYFRTTDVTGRWLSCQKAFEMVIACDNISVKVKTDINRLPWKMACDLQSVKGCRTVGAGVDCIQYLNNKII